MPERITTTINQISASDTPARKGWQRVSKLYPHRFTEIPVNLDLLGIKIERGIAHEFVPSDGMHRLAKVLQHNGVVSVTFSLSEVSLGVSEYMDIIVNQTKRDGVDNLQVFLEMCLTERFIREDTA